MLRGGPVENQVPVEASPCGGSGRARSTDYHRYCLAMPEDYQLPEKWSEDAVDEHGNKLSKR